MKYNKLILVLGLFIVAAGGSSCKKYLQDAFPNPNKPTSVDPDIAFPPMENIMARGVEFDSRFITRYVQYLSHTTAGTTWDLMGYDPGSDNGADQWRTHYYSFGQNMINAINQGRATGRPAYCGAGYAMFAWSWMVLTDNHGEVILDEAFNADQLTFKYNTQPAVYAYAMKLTDSALYYLNQAKGMAASSFSTGDQFIYNGDLDKWVKFVYAVKAMLYHRYFLKSNYNPDSVISNVNRSFASNADNCTVKIPASNPFTDGYNFFSATRGNMHLYRQSDYVIALMNGTSTAFPGVMDPRMKFLFRPSASGLYTGVKIGRGLSSLVTAQQPPNFYSQFSVATPVAAMDSGARHFFKNNSPFPVVTYTELQFMKAEAALKKGDMATAKAAYVAGINGSFDLLTSLPAGGYTAISAGDRADYLASPNVVPSGNVTLSQIMLQKYLALWPYGSEETWVDMRRYQYSPAVYLDFTFPTTASGGSNFYTDNNNLPAYRIRPRYNSEYLWNVDELRNLGTLDSDLDKAGALDPAYHTKKPWFAKP